MNYYNNVKDSVKGSNDTSKPNFDTLREAAQETSEQEDDKGDDTEIEVLKDGLGSQSQSTSSSNQSQNNQVAKSKASGDADLSGLEQKLDKIIEQNERMIEVLESFGS